MGMNVHEINASKGVTFTLASGATSSTYRIGSATIGVVVVETGTVDVDIQVSNDGTNFYTHLDAEAITATQSRVITSAFKYIRAVETAAAGGSAVVSFSW